MIKLKCNNCNKEFDQELKHYNRRIKIGKYNFYCFYACCGKKIERPSRCKPIEKICGYCKITFQSYTGKRGRKCCSLKCARKLAASFTPHTKESCKKISISIKKKWKNKKYRNKCLKNFTKNQMVGRIFSHESKRKMRLSAIKRIERNRFDGHQMSPGFNPRACQFIEEYGKQHGYNFQHAMNGGEFHIEELGYWVDGYDKEKNVVFEYDEPHHNIKQEKNDLQRMNEIKNHLKCTFIRYNEKTKKCEFFI